MKINSINGFAIGMEVGAMAHVAMRMCLLLVESVGDDRGDGE